MAALLLAAVPGWAGGPIFRGGSFGLGFYAPSHYGYNLDDLHPGYFGGSRYREYYSYGRGYGLANYPGPLPGPVYSPHYGLLPPHRLPPVHSPPAPPEYPLPTAPPSSAVAYLTVETPPGADVWLEGVKSRQPGPTRRYVSPPLTPGARYAYAIRARWTEDGREMEQTQEVTFQAGDRLTVRFPIGPDLELLPTPQRLSSPDER